MKSTFYASKDEIKNRILKNAEDFWNIKDSNNFDPLVKLIIEALSNELFNVVNDVKDLENRIFDKLSRILAPEFLTSALPAHAIIHAKPTEQKVILAPTFNFSLEKNLDLNADQLDRKKTEIYFTPLHQVTLNQAEIKYVFSSTHFYKIAGLNRTSMANPLNGNGIKPNTIYIGIDGFNSPSKLSDLNLFFDWRNYSVPEHLYDLLSYVKCSYQDQPISLLSDQFMEDHIIREDQNPFHHKQLLSTIKADVLQHYSKYFKTLGNCDHLIDTNEDKYPNELKDLLDTLVKDKDLLWLKLEFPSAFTPDSLAELNISLNAFPVVNKKVIEIKQRPKIMNNIIPLKMSDIEQMLVVEELKDNNGKYYKEIPFATDFEEAEGAFSIRYGGTERFDSRNATQLIDYLFELIRDEKASFSAHGADFLNHALKNLEQNISLIEQKSISNKKNNQDLPNYLVIKAIDQVELFFLDLWVTQAEFANKISFGTKLKALDHKVQTDSVYFLTNTKGGRSRLSSNNRVQAYKYALTTGDRVITKADIINFCKFELGDKALQIEIEKGLVLDQKPNGGFYKTIDILIKPNLQASIAESDWLDLMDLTLSKLKLRSTMDVNYRMLIKH